MIKPYFTARFRKDVRLAVKRGKRVEKLTALVKLLCAGDPLPERYFDHALSGKYKGFCDCHIEPDWIVIYRIEQERLMLVLSRTGTHNDLF